MISDGKTVGYVRVSTQSQVDNGDGLETQRKRIADFSNEKGYPVSKFYSDEGISGAVKDRPALLNLLRDCELGKVKRVLVYRMDRFAREMTISLFLETQFRKYDVEVLSVVEPELGDDPLEKAFRRIAYVFAELEKDVLTARMLDGKINKAKNGERASGPIPYGYMKVGDKLEINPEEAKWVGKMFRWRARGFNYTKIVKELNKKGAQTKRKNLFHVEAVKYILQNPMYYGETNFGSIKCEGVHEPIISKRLFMKVQRKNFYKSKNIV